jgi:hypothetical protein
MKKRLFGVICIIILIVGSIAILNTVQEKNRKDLGSDADIIIKYNNGEVTAGKSINDKICEEEILNSHKFENGSTYVKEADTSGSYNMKNSRDIFLVEKDAQVQIMGDTDPSEANYDSAGEELTWNILRVNANLLHDMGIKGKGVRVALFDTGIALDNDDIIVTGGVSFVEGVSGYDDDNGHGTAMAGILAAQLNGSGFVGVAPEVELYSVKVLDKNGEGRYSNIIRGIEWAIDNDMDIIALSLGGTEYSQILNDAVEHAIAHNILIVAAAGNNGGQPAMYPAAYPQVICVGAVDNDNKPAGFSNPGSALDIAAPGLGILTTGLNNTVTMVSGSSAAVQHVTGAAALLWSADNNLSTGEIKNLLYNNAVELDEFLGIGHCGLLDIRASYQSMLQGEYSNIKPDEEFMPTEIFIDAEKETHGIVYAQACTHNWVTTSTTSATCTTPKLINYICTKCQATKSAASGTPMGHVVSTTTTPATCTATGKTVVKCTRSGCGYTTTSTIPALGHSTSSTTTPPTCTATGKTVTKCTRSGCSYSTTTTIPAMGHSMSYGTMVPPKCTTDGIYPYRCSRCGYDQSNIIPALGHDLSAPAVTKPATCYESGETVATCRRSGCSYTKTGIIPQLTHNPVITVSSVHNADWGHKYTKSCTICSDTLSITYEEPSIYFEAATHTAGSGHYYKNYCPICTTYIYSSGYKNYMTTTLSPTHTAGQGHRWTYYCTSCSTIESSGYNNSSHTVMDSSVGGHTSSGHLARNICDICGNVNSSYYSLSTYSSTGGHTSSGHTVTTYCSICNTSMGSYTRPITTYKTTGAHTSTGHLISTYCSDCGYLISSGYSAVSTCLSCTTPPSVSFGNITGATILTEANTAFQLQIKVQDNENDTLTCNYYLNGSATPSGTVTATGTSSQKTVTFPNTINALNLSEGSHTLRITAKDSIAPAGEATVTFKVDRSAPVINSVTPSSATTSVTINVIASDRITELAANAYRYTAGGMVTGWLAQNSYSFLNLTANTNYIYKVEVMDKVGHIAESSGSISTKVATPVVSATAMSENMIQIIINDGNPTGTNYRIQTDNGFIDANGGIVSSEVWIMLATDSSTGGKSLIASGLAPNTNYNITATARNTFTGEISIGTKVSVQTSPDIPANLISPAKSNRYIQLAWSSVAGAASYQLYRETLSNEGTVLASKTFAETPLLVCEDSEVAADQNYRYKIRAKNSAGLYGCWSAYLAVRTLPDPPAKVTGVSADADGGILNIAWNPAATAIGYKVFITYNGTTVERSSTVNHLNFDTGLFNCQCNITVRAFNVYEGSDAADSTKWSNGGEISESTICYTKANIPVMDATVQNITTTTATITWQANGNPDSVEYILGIFKDDTLVTQINYRSIALIADGCTVNNLTPETSYIFKVKARNSSMAETDWSNGVSVTTLMDYPAIPGRLRATAKADKITLSWDAADKAQSYRIERNGSVIAADYIATSFIDSGLNPETEYTYKVCAVNTTGESWSQPLIKKTLGNLPASPVITAVTGSSISLTIDWTAVEGASGYDIDADGHVYNTGLTTSYIHNGLAPGSWYTYKVRTRNIYGKGDWSEPVSVQTTPIAPGVPGNVLVTPSDTQILISWFLASGADYYEAEIDGAVISNIAALQYLYTVQGENLAGSEHTVRIRAVNGGGYGEWSDIRVAVLLAEGEGNIPVAPVPAAPIAVCSVSGSAIIFVTWNAVEDATVYQLEADNTIIYTGPNTGYVHMGLAENSLHQYRVCAGNLSGFSDWSNPVTAATNATITTAPGNIIYYREDDTHMMITWDQVTGAAGYRIEVNGVIGDNIINDIRTSITTVPGEQYNIRIASVILDGDTEIHDWSEEITFRAPDTLPAIPSIEDISATSDTITLSWGAVTGAAGYELMTDGQLVNLRNSLTHSITDLEPSTSYTLRLRAYNEAGASDWSEANTIMTNEGIPGVPINIIGKSVTDVSAVTGSAISVTGSAISLKWDGPEGAVSYEVEDENGVISAADINEIIIGNLLPGEQYIFRVRALTAAGAGAWSSWIAVVPVVSRPDNVQTLADGGIVHISWDKIGGAEYYELELDGITVAATDETGFDFSYGTFYKQRSIRVRACSGAQKSEWSAVVIFNQALPVTIDLVENEEFSVILPVSNANIDKYKLTLTYNTEELVLADAYEMTQTADIQSTYIEEFNTYIMLDQLDGTGTITFIVQTGGNNIWSGTAGSIKFRSLVTGTVTIHYAVTDK